MVGNLVLLIRDSHLVPITLISLIPTRLKCFIVSVGRIRNIPSSTTGRQKGDIFHKPVDHRHRSHKTLYAGRAVEMQRPAAAKSSQPADRIGKMVRTVVSAELVAPAPILRQAAAAGGIERVAPAAGTEQPGIGAGAEQVGEALFKGANGRNVAQTASGADRRDARLLTAASAATGSARWCRTPPGALLADRLHDSTTVLGLNLLPAVVLVVVLPTGDAGILALPCAVERPAGHDAGGDAVANRDAGRTVSLVVVLTGPVGVVRAFGPGLFAGGEAVSYLSLKRPVLVHQVDRKTEVVARLEEVLHRGAVPMLAHRVTAAVHVPAPELVVCIVPVGVLPDADDAAHHRIVNVLADRRAGDVLLLEGQPVRSIPELHVHGGRRAVGRLLSS